MARDGSKYLGILNSASIDSGELGIVLSSAQQILDVPSGATDSDLGPLKPTLVIQGKDLDEVQAYQVRLGDSEKETKLARERECECSTFDMVLLLELILKQSYVWTNR